VQEAAAARKEMTEKIFIVGSMKWISTI